MIRFTVRAVPIRQPRQRHRSFKIGDKVITQNYTPRTDKVQDFKASVRAAAETAYSGPPLDGPVFLRLVFVMPRPRAMIWKSKPMPRCRHTVKPDLDNLEKSVKDALTKLLWRDDSQVCSVKKSKWIAAGDEQPGVIVEVEHL